MKRQQLLQGFAKQSAEGRVRWGRGSGSAFRHDRQGMLRRGPVLLLCLAVTACADDVLTPVGDDSIERIGEDATTSWEGERALSATAKVRTGLGVQPTAGLTLTVSRCRPTAGSSSGTTRTTWSRV